VAVSTLGLRRIAKDLAAVLGRPVIYRPPFVTWGCAAVAGWGHKRTAWAARTAAGIAGLPYLALEDGFLRSIRPGRAEPSASYIADAKGIYTDASGPSDLAGHIGAAQAALAADGLNRAREGLAFLRRNRLSKYNAAPGRSLAELGLTRHAKRLLLLDQTFGDASISGAGADSSNFAAMLKVARGEHSGSEIIVKLHPETVAGAKRGYLSGMDLSGMTVLGEGVDPWSLIEAVDQVFTVSSLLGFEALLAGCGVTCFGKAFYHGWGLTRSGVPEAHIERGMASKEALFLGGYIGYSRYLDAWRRTPVEFETAAAQVAYLKRRYHENAPSVCLHVTPWKRRAVERFLNGPGSPLTHVDTVEGAIAEAKRRKARLVVWAAKEPPGLGQRAAAEGLALYRLEDGFVRSVGLGAKLVPPASLVLDADGIYYDPTGASACERIASETIFTPALLARAAALREAIVGGRVSKYNEGAAPPLALPRQPYRVLVPGQVENDASILKGTLGVATNLALLEAARARHPRAIIIYKPHPDVAAGLRPGAIPPDRVMALADGTAEGWNMADLLEEVDRVETMTSLTGFEALMRGKPVSVHGQPFYAGWGLTEDLAPVARRQRRLTLDELVAVTLMLYPRYVDPVSLRPCEPELVVERFAEILKSGPPPPSPLRDGFARLVHGVVIPLWSRTRRRG
jgi:capsular polysaccharide export protein